MTIVHSYESSVNIDAILSKYQFLLPILGIVCLFTQFRGIFIYVSGMLTAYRFGGPILSKLLSAWNSNSDRS